MNLTEKEIEERVERRNSRFRCGPTVAEEMMRLALEASRGHTDADRIERIVAVGDTLFAFNGSDEQCTDEDGDSSEGDDCDWGEIHELAYLSDGRLVIRQCRVCGCLGYFDEIPIAAIW